MDDLEEICTIETFKKLFSNEEWKKSFSENYEMAKNMLEPNGEKLNKFDKYLEILSDDYKEYVKIIKKLNQEVDEELEKEIGVTREEFFKGLIKN
ncbi:hypothetical protein [Clostridium novyi]|uniref:hypothetical protein n=1 Tax=Clostridium novyi TaxID=1542 RepID=UPI00068CC128|nr:hypothetical protein [Clostridium novyi]